MEHSIFFKNVTEKYKVHDETLDALRDINFTAVSGDVIGIIGMDGAGKSTLANLLTGQAQPTSGEVDITGEASLISQTSEFNPKLTGRENIELKCMILGFNKKEITERMPDIIAFADLSNDIDESVNNYSDEMKVRLAFAISTFIDPDIVVIDEALSVVDQVFADKCVDKINEWQTKGKTIFLISHSIEQIKRICQKILWFEDGKVKAHGSAEEIIPQYEKFLTPPEVTMEAEQHATSENQAHSAEAVPVAAAAEQEQETTSAGAEQDAAVSRRELRHAHKKRRNFSPLIKIAIIVLGVVALVYTGIALIGKSAQFASTEPEEDPGPDIRYVMGDKADIRTKPEFGSEKASTANFGQGFIVTETRDSSARSVTWLKVESSTTGEKGWVSDQLVKKLDHKINDEEAAETIDTLIGFTPALEDAIPMIGKTKGEEEAFDYTEYKYEDDQVIGFTITVNDSSKSELHDALGEAQLERQGAILYHGSEYDFIFTLGNGVIEELTVVKNEL